MSEIGGIRDRRVQACQHDVRTCRRCDGPQLLHIAYFTAVDELLEANTGAIVRRIAVALCKLLAKQVRVRNEQNLACGIQDARSLVAFINEDSSWWALTLECFPGMLGGRRWRRRKGWLCVFMLLWSGSTVKRFFRQAVVSSISYI